MKSKVVEYSFGHKKRVKSAIRKDPTNSNINSLIDILFSTFIVCFVGSRTASDSLKGLGEDIEKNDAYYFELGCYFFYLIDVWHVDNGYEFYRNSILYGTIANRFLQLFRNSMRCADLEDVFHNRIGLYFKYLRESFNVDGDAEAKSRYLIGRERFYFEQLALRALDGVPLEVIDFDKMPVYLVGISKTWVVETQHASVTSAMLPPLKNAFQYIYDQLAKNKTANFDEEEKETKYCPNCKTEVAPTFHGLCPECDLEL